MAEDYHPYLLRRRVVERRNDRGGTLATVGQCEFVIVIA